MNEQQVVRRYKYAMGAYMQYIYVNRYAIKSKRKQENDKVNLKTRSYFLWTVLPEENEW